MSLIQPKKKSQHSIFEGPILFTNLVTLLQLIMKTLETFRKLHQGLIQQQDLFQHKVHSHSFKLEYFITYTDFELVKLGSLEVRNSPSCPGNTNNFRIHYFNLVKISFEENVIYSGKLYIDCLVVTKIIFRTVQNCTFQVFTTFNKNAYLTVQ